jgi:single-strand DNA-binding protein
MYYNNINLIGRLGDKPEMSVTDSGKTLCKMSLGQSYKTGEGDNKREVTMWHKVVAWGKAAENHGKYLDKGSKVFVSGQLKYNKFETEDGQRVKNAEISADQIVYLNSLSANNEAEAVFDINSAAASQPVIPNESAL